VRYETWSSCGRPKTWVVLFLILLPLNIGRAGQAQSDAQLTLSQANVDAGDPLAANLTLPTPAVCDTSVFVLFSLANGNGREEFYLAAANVRKGETSAHLTGTLARDRQGGTYHAIRAFFNPCPGYEGTKEFTVPDLTVTVRAIPDPNVYPTTADLVLSVTQKQFFDTKIAELNKLEVQLTTKIEGKAADLPELRVFLAQIVESAERDLTVTESQYSDQILKSKESPLPAFFADFHHQYQILRVQLQAPIQGVGRTMSISRPARLIYVQQLKKREPAQPKMPPQNTTGVYPAIVTAVRSVMGDNKAVYNTVKSGRVNTVVSITSHPTGAHIQYRYSYETTYRDYSALTDVQRAKLELVSYTFKFHKDGCTDEPVFQLDPYEDPDPVVDIEFQGCRHR
jgi:hypothetical protein